MFHSKLVSGGFTISESFKGEWITFESFLCLCDMSTKIVCHAKQL